MRWTDPIADACEKWNRKRCDCIAVLIQHGKRNVRDPSDLVAGHFLVTPLADSVQMANEIAWQRPAGSLLPFCECTISHRALLKCKNQVAGGGVEKVNPRTELQCESGGSRRVHLVDDNHFPIAQHRQVARLPSFVGYLLHKRTCFRGETVQGRMVVRELKKFQREFVSLVGCGLRNIAAVLETHEHPENLADRTAKVPSYFACGEPYGFRCE
jgi:hypothetical protein